MITHTQLTLAEFFENCQNKFDNDIDQFLSLYDPYKAAYGSMPSHIAANPVIQQKYINGHFCYAYKLDIITNGLGIVRNITFYNKDFLNTHSDIMIMEKFGSPDEDKSLADSKTSLPVLTDFFLRTDNLHLSREKSSRVSGRRMQFS